jgi:hypothetical protein
VLVVGSFHSRDTNVAVASLDDPSDGVSATGGWDPLEADDDDPLLEDEVAVLPPDPLELLLPVVEPEGFGRDPPTFVSTVVDVSADVEPPDVESVAVDPVSETVVAALVTVEVVALVTVEVVATVVSEVVAVVVSWT